MVSRGGILRNTGGTGGSVTEDVFVPAIALFEHPEDATTLFEAVDGGAAGLTVTLREPLEYGQDTSDWGIVGAQRYQGVAGANAQITGNSFAHARYLGEFTTANAPARDALTQLHVYYDTTLGRFQVGDDGVDWRDITSAEWQAIFGNANVPWNPTGGWANGLGSDNFYEYADQAAVETSLTDNYARWTGGQYGSSEGVLWFDQSDGDLKTFGPVTAPVEEVDPDPVHAVADEDNTEITVYYNIAAGGALTGPDSLGDIKGAIDTAAEGLSSEYVGGGDMDTDVTRPFVNRSQFSQADLRGLQLMLTPPAASGAQGNSYAVVARGRFAGGAEVTERQAHILIYTNTGRSGGIRVTLDAGIQGLNQHGIPVDVSSGALGNEWHFVTREGTENTESVSVSPTNRQIIFTSNRLGLDETFASQVLNAINQGGTGVTATTFGGYGGSRHVFRGSLGDLNASINRFHDGRDYHPATANPEPITVTQGPTHAHVRLYTRVDGGIVLSLVDPAHDGGNGYEFEASDAAALAFVVTPNQERVDLELPAAGSPASEILAAATAHEALSAVYFGMEDGTTNVQSGRFGRQEFLGGLDAREIEIQYAPVASGGIANPDTMGDVKTAWDAIDGLTSFYYNGADAATVASRLVPWEHEFEGGETDRINLSGFGLGPEQNEFIGADRAAAEAARDAYAAANPQWVEAYRGKAHVWISLRWGTSQVGQILRSTASNPPVNDDWISQDLALKGGKGDRGNPGRDGLDGSDATVNATNVDPLIQAYSGGIPGLNIPDAQLPASIMRDNEFTAAAVRGLMGLTQAELDSLLIGDGANITSGILNIPQNDGNTLSLTLPTGGGGVADGVINSLTIVGNTLTAGISTGGSVDLDLAPYLDARFLNQTDNLSDVPDPGAARTNLAVLDQGEVRNEATASFQLVTDFPANPYNGQKVIFTGDAMGLADAVDENDMALATASLGDGFEYVAAETRWERRVRLLAGIVARVAALEGTDPHALTRYAALGADGAVPSDFTEAMFLAAGATNSMNQDITTPASNTAMVVGIAVPLSEGPLTGVAELASDGTVNQFATMIRANFLPAVGNPEVSLEIDGVDHYVYCTNSTIRALFLGVIGYRLTQTAP